MHFRVVLRNLNSAVRLAFDEEQGQLKLLGRVGSRLVDIEATLVVQHVVRHLDVPLLELGDGHLLLDELQEELLLVPDSLTGVSHLLLALFEHLKGKTEALLTRASWRGSLRVLATILRGAFDLVWHTINIIRVRPLDSKVCRDMLIIVVVDDIVLVLADDIHG